ncbi:hypothetical protein JCGZ_07401 [Jatropha curcas]|uniref:beta-galactosidase n=2 Tax=Jatropha curcas TaxID=180498 RepID=A0A067KNH2_JATCU|nr:hypothetical protein JCGZ_07401 [Jatropha curcas]
MWTENWSGWYTEWGGSVPYRPPEDVAFSVARFLANSGSFVNYYMYHGGTNFGRTAGLFMASSYDYDAPLDEWGLTHDPKWGHLRDLHSAVKLCEPALTAVDPELISLGKNQEAYVFQTKTACAAFLANYDTQNGAEVNFWNVKYWLERWSISILPDCKTVVYNTAKIGAQDSQMWMIPVIDGFSWQSHNDEVTIGYANGTFSHEGLWEQKFLTYDKTDYLWYMTNVDIDANEGFLKGGKNPTLTIDSSGHVLHVFINGQLAGTVYGSLATPQIKFSQQVKLVAGANKISLLSATVGLPNVGVHFDTWSAGILGPVTLTGLNKGTLDLTKWEWSYKVGLKGEDLDLPNPAGSASGNWVQGAQLAKNQPLTWYKTTFDAPAGNEPLALDMISMGKGQMYVNGASIGRHWAANKARGKCGDCDYAGTYTETKCRSKCGEPSQQYYHVPRSWLKPKGNLLVVLEEIGGDPSKIAMVRRTVGAVCADIDDDQPEVKSWKELVPVTPKAKLWCPEGQTITKIIFASYGWPQGRCGTYQQGKCHAQKSYDPFQGCVGKAACEVEVAPATFGGDPCPGSKKRLSVQLQCS